MLRLPLFPVSVEAPHFRRSFWKTAVRKLKRGIQRALSRDSQFRQRTAALRPRRPPRSIAPAPPIGESPIPRRLQNLQISSAPKFLRLQCQTFPNFCGSNAKFLQRFLWRLCGISKGCVRSKPENRLSKFLSSEPGSKSRRGRPIKSAGCRATCLHSNRVSTFRKKMSSFVQRGNAPQAACANRPQRLILLSDGEDAG